MNKILLVEDNESIVKGLKYSLEQEGFEVKIASTLSDIELTDISLIVLDIGMPDGNSIEILPDLKIKTKVPIIFLTAFDSEDIIVRCFELGADDYIVKPFRTRELISRINRLLNKTTHLLTYKDIKIDLDSSRVYKKEEEIPFTALEYKLLVMFLSNIDKVITREQVLDKILDISGNYVNDNTLTVYIKRIRSKIGEDIIKTVKGIGYRVDKNEKVG